MPFSHSLHLHQAAVIVISLLTSLDVSSSMNLQLDHFSSKTAYNWTSSFNNLTQEERQGDDFMYHLNAVAGSTCSAVHVSAVSRHGARYPGEGDIEDISDVYEKLKKVGANMTAELKQWTNRFPQNVPKKDEKELTLYGKHEQEALGLRVAIKLRSLFANRTASDFRFITSSSKRAKQSARAFFHGLTGIVPGVFPKDGYKVNDTLMRFFEKCQKYLDQVDNNETSKHEQVAFLNGPQVLKVKEKVDKHLAIVKDVLTTEDVSLMYKICAYETATFDSPSSPSPWCALLDEDDLEVLEYAGDLKHQNKNGYSHDITWQGSCPLISEMFTLMDRFIVHHNRDHERAGDVVTGQFAFGHAETVGPVVTSLGLFKDLTPLTANNFASQRDRKWRVSDILPFSANVMFVMYECVAQQHGGGGGGNKSDFYLKLFVNEVATMMPGCQELHCPYATARKKYQSQVDECHFDSICGNDADSDRTTSDRTTNSGNDNTTVEMGMPATVIALLWVLAVALVGAFVIVAIVVCKKRGGNKKRNSKQKPSSQNEEIVIGGTPQNEENKEESYRGSSRHSSRRSSRKSKIGKSFQRSSHRSQHSEAQSRASNTKSYQSDGTSSSTEEPVTASRGSQIY